MSEVDADVTTQRVLTLADIAGGGEVTAHRWSSKLPGYIGNRMARLERSIFAAKCLNILLVRDRLHTEDKAVNETSYEPIGEYMRDGLEAGLELAIDGALENLAILEELLPKAVCS